MSLNHCPKVTDVVLIFIITGIQLLVSNNPNIKHLNIDDCHQLLDRVFTVIAQGLGHSLVGNIG